MNAPRFSKSGMKPKGFKSRTKQGNGGVTLPKFHVVVDILVSDDREDRPTVLILGSWIT